MSGPGPRVRLRAALLAGVLGAGSWSCRPEPPSPDAIALVGDEEVLYSEFSEYVEAETESSVAALEGEVLANLLDQYLTERLLVRAAVDRGLVPAGTGNRDALGALIQAAPAAEVPQPDLVARYRDETERLTLPERVRVSQVLTETRQGAEAALAEIARGADFGEVAARYSTDPSGPFGGIQGELARADLPEEFADVIFALEPGQVSGIVEADYGFHVFLVTERLPARVVPFEEAAPALAEAIREERVDAWLERVVEEARSRYTVRVYERNLPFRYDAFASGPEGPMAGPAPDAESPLPAMNPGDDPSRVP